MTQKTVVITGGSRGLGLSLAKRFAHAGDKVIVLSKTPCNVRDVRHVVCDVTVPYDVAKAAELVRSTTSGIDIWFNNAAISDRHQLFVEQQDPHTFREIVNTNLVGSMLCTRAAIDAMADQDRMGHIFLCSGAGGDGTATPGFPAYGASKAAVVQFAKTLRQECDASATNIGIHVVSPGLMATGLLMDNISDRLYPVMEILADDPENVAKDLHASMCAIVKNKSRHQFVRHFNVARVLGRLLRRRFW